MRAYLKRSGVDGEDTIVFQINSRDHYIRRAALKRGWHENPILNSCFFDFKYDYYDN